MLSSLACSVFVIYLYRKLNSEERSSPDGEPASLESEIAAINARIAALEREIVR